ncbi:MAG TPA: methyltransferase domain-containing protein [Bryobacterales bacterium]|nr:methyltransferase domain-containing protein [Bryobacterales bacterium]
MSHFTGERVIPGEVEVDLLNEHLARYAFAARLARGKRVLDAGCGAGYGAARLAACARRVVGLDIAAEAVDAARQQYALPRLEFLRADCRDLPFASGSVDLIVAFEVIEHLEQWERLLAETRRVLAPGGELILSTPNRLYYSESRESPNPFHVHEFDYREFCTALDSYFPHRRVFFENHAEGVVFSPSEPSGVETAIEAADADPDAAHFFVAVCSTRPLHGSPAFVYIPQAGNVLREREKHIALLDSELEQKNQWLEQTKESLDTLHREHQALEAETARDRARAQQIIDELEQENARKTEWTRQVEAEVERLKGVVEGLQAELDQQREWNLKLQAENVEVLANYRRLEEQVNQVRADLKTCVDQLHATEAELADRTAWAQGLDRQVAQLTSDLNAILGSPAYRIGKRLRLAPVTASDPRSRQS